MGGLHIWLQIFAVTIFIKTSYHYFFLHLEESFILWNLEAVNTLSHLAIYL